MKVKYFAAMASLAFAAQNIHIPATQAAVPTTALAAPTALAATSINNTSVTLTWSRVKGALYYRLYRGSNLARVSRAGIAVDSSLAMGTAYVYTVSDVSSHGESAKSAPVTVTTLDPLPATPTGLTADAQWVTSCPMCNGMAMAHNVLSWSVADKAASYSVYRDGTLVAANVASPNYTDMTVTSGQKYSYQVTGVNPFGASAMSAAATAVALNPPMVGALQTPKNLSDTGSWNNAAIDTLTWDQVPGAVAYNIYLYNTLVAHAVVGTTYTVPSSVVLMGATYTVTALDAMNTESIPSAPCVSVGALNPANLPSWVSSAGPNVPTHLAASTDWNNGAPRVHLVWDGDGSVQTFVVYKDGVKVATGLFGLNFLDTMVKPGETHSYQVSGLNTWWPGGVEGAKTSPVSISAASGAPMHAAPVTIIGVVPNDDSAVVYFNAVPGAQDYRIYDTANPGMVKYSGGSLSIEFNGMNPATGADVVVEAVDKLGPFQTSDGQMGPGAMQMGGGMAVAINGQGDPSNVPNVIASSATFHISLAPKGLSGGQAFFDNFRNDTQFVQSLTIDPLIAAANGGDAPDAANRYVREFTNNNWLVREYNMDLADSKIFIMNNHFMDTIYDGGSPRTNISLHMANGTLVMAPKQVADISGGKVIHVTFEVDPHMDGRRWCDVFLTAAGDPLLVPGKFAETNSMPTVSGNIFRFEVTRGNLQAQIFNGPTNCHDLIQSTSWADMNSTARVAWNGVPMSNGTDGDMDKRHKFDLYVSHSHYRFTESAPDGTVLVSREKDFPAGVVLPFDNIQVYFVHQIYHTGNDRPELMSYSPADSYWYNYRPWCDERHWDNMGQEVLLGFPAI